MFESVDNATGTFCKFTAFIVHIVVQMMSAQHFCELAIVTDVIEMTVQWMRNKVNTFGRTYDFDVIEMLFFVGHNWAFGSRRCITSLCSCIVVKSIFAFHHCWFAVHTFVVTGGAGARIENVWKKFKIQIRLQSESSSLTLNIFHCWQMCCSPVDRDIVYCCADTQPRASIDSPLFWCRTSNQPDIPYALPFHACN